MKENTGLSPFAEKYPERFFDVGIAEEHAVTFASGMASMGIVPVFAVYSTFLQRAYDQLIHDVAIANNHVVLAIDRAGIVGDDGETHQGIFDVSFLTNIPKCSIYAPSCISELDWALEKAVHCEVGLSCVRYPRGFDKTVYPKQNTITDYYISTSKNATDTLVVTYGRTYDSLYRAKKLLRNEQVYIDTLKLTKIYPLSEDVILKSLSYKNIVFLEEGIRNGGIAEHFGILLLKHGYKGNYYISAIDGFVYAGSVHRCLERYNLTTNTIVSYLKDTLGKAESFNES
jgi:1-deoxy-D-xylulose-5-phosphate synthase